MKFRNHNFVSFSGKVEERKMTEVELPYRSEYAKSGRSSCKACKTTIEKASLRVAAMVQGMRVYLP